jgi:exo-beta-1,3-glucanase (GH17 family)
MEKTSERRSAMISRGMDTKKLIAVYVMMVLFVIVIAGCGSTKYYKITDTSNGNVYFAKDAEIKKNGVVIFKDAQNANQMKLKNVQVMNLSKDEFNAAVMSAPASVVAFEMDSSSTLKRVAGGKALSLSPYLANSQCPGAFGEQVSNDCLNSLLDTAASHTKWVRTYGSSLGLENIPALAKKRGLMVAAGAYVDGSDANTQIQNLMNNVNSGLVDLAIVGNEAMQHGVPQATLIAYINEAKALRKGKGANVPVTTCLTGDDVFMSSNAPVLAVCDVICDNMYPNFGQSVSDALANLEGYYNGMARSNQVGGKQLIMGETGWPSGGTGSPNFTPDNASAFHNGIVQWASGAGVLAFYFESFDEPPKGDANGESHYGIWDQNRKLKQGMKP